MGASEKHAATYHGGEYTPSELALITAWCDQRRNLLEYNDQPPEGIVERTEQAQRTLAKIRAEAKQEALNEVANAFQYKAWSELIQGSLQDRLRVAQPITAWLRARANQYKEGADNGR